MNNIITISGDPGSGKSSTAEVLKKQFEQEGKKVVIYDIGKSFRELAQKRGMTVEELNKKAESESGETDKGIDGFVEELGKKIAQENDPDTVYIIGSRLAWFTIPESFKIRLTINDEFAGKRVFNDSTRGEEDRYKTLEDAIEATRSRKKSEIERYISIYGKKCDISNNQNFDLIINTELVTQEDVAKTIVRNWELKQQGKDICKNWASPKVFLPTQDLMTSIAPTKNSSRREFYFNKPINGHHRVLNAVIDDIQLIPYKCLAKDEEEIPKLRMTPRKMMKNILNIFDYNELLHSYEEFIMENKTSQEEPYRYEDAYPKIYDLSAESEIFEEKDREER